MREKRRGGGWSGLPELSSPSSVPERPTLARSRLPALFPLCFFTSGRPRCSNHRIIARPPKVAGNTDGSRLDAHRRTEQTDHRNRPRHPVWRADAALLAARRAGRGTRPRSPGETRPASRRRPRYCSAIPPAATGCSIAIARIAGPISRSPAARTADCAARSMAGCSMPRVPAWNSPQSRPAACSI